MATKWIGRWAGGRIARTRGGKVFYLERRAGGRQRTWRLGTISEGQANEELQRFELSPATYRSAAEQRGINEDERQAEEHARQAAAAAEVWITVERVKRYLEWLKADKQRGLGHRQDMARYIRQWALALEKRDLRRVSVEDLHRTLDGWPTARQKRIAAIKGFCHFLRNRGELKPHEDASLALESPQYRRPSPGERAKRIASLEILAKTYAAIRSQTTRDVFRVRLLTGLHLSEVKRIAQGEGALVETPGLAPIAGTITVRHKRGHDHVQSVDARTLAALKRLQSSSAKLNRKVLNENLKRAAAQAGLPRVRMAHLRHNFITHAQTSGEIHQPNGKGVSLSTISRIVGHTTTAMTAAYDGTTVPPLVMIRGLNLVHPDDPRATRRGGHAGNGEGSRSRDHVPGERSSRPRRPPGARR